MSKRYLRKRQVANRYGGIALRSVERGVEAGRIPKPEYPCGPGIPMWDEEILEENERLATVGGIAFNWLRFFSKLAAAATREDAALVLHQYHDDIASLPEADREQLATTAQNIIAEKE